jgi:hypothetical protein
MVIIPYVNLSGETPPFTKKSNNAVIAKFGQ